MQTREIIVASVAATSVGVLAYALFFDYQRRNNPEFRRHLRRSARRVARGEKEASEAAKLGRRREIRQAVDRARDEGFPSNEAGREEFFLTMVSQAERFAAEGKEMDSALAFYKAMKVYPTPADLIQIYDKNVPKFVLDVLAEMIAYDGTLHLAARSAGTGAGSGAGASAPMGLFASPEVDQIPMESFD